jgi:hypothetical protein
LSDSDLIHPLLCAINENQAALDAALQELSNWIERQGGVEATRNARAALEAIDRNNAFIKISLAMLTSPR